MLHLVQPARPGGRGGDEGRATRFDETGRRVAPGDTPQHARYIGAAAGIGNLTHRTEAPCIGYLRAFVHSVSACDLGRAPSSRLYPRRAWSLDMTRSARKPITASENLPVSTQISARCFAQVSCSSPRFMSGAP